MAEVLAAGASSHGSGVREQVSALVQRWPELEELKRCAPRTSAAHRWSQALSTLTAVSRAVLDAALLAERSRRRGVAVSEEVNLAVMVVNGAVRFEEVRLLLWGGGLRAMAAEWRLDEGRIVEAEDRLARLVGPPVVFGSDALPPWALRPDGGEAVPFPLAVLLFGSALGAGWP